jgi:hypothetical protein
MNQHKGSQLITPDDDTKPVTPGNVISADQIPTRPKKPEGTKRITSHITKGKPPRRRLVRLMLIVVGLCLVAGLIFYVTHRQAPTTCSQKRQCAALLKEGIKSLDPKKAKDLDKTVAKIKKYPDYQHEPSLLFIMVTYYINRTDATNARTYLTMLANSYDQQKGYDKLLAAKGINAQEPILLAQTVKSLEEQQKSLQSNFYGVPPQ